MPYGRWTAEDGREILFNRDYSPIWQRLPGQAPEPADPKEWVKGILTQDWFYSDKHREPAKRNRAKAALIAWGLPVPTNADAKPYRLRQDRWGQLRLASQPAQNNLAR